MPGTKDQFHIPRDQAAAAQFSAYHLKRMIDAFTERYYQLLEREPGKMAVAQPPVERALGASSSPEDSAEAAAGSRDNAETPNCFPLTIFATEPSRQAFPSQSSDHAQLRKI